MQNYKTSRTPMLGTPLHTQGCLHMNQECSCEIQGRGPSHLGSGQDRSEALSWVAVWVLRFLAFTWSQVALSLGQRLIRGLTSGCKPNSSSPPVLDQQVPSHQRAGLEISGGCRVLSQRAWKGTWYSKLKTPGLN